MARPFLAPFRRLLRLAGSRWRYSTPPPHGFFSSLTQSSGQLPPLCPSADRTLTRDARLTDWSVLARTRILISALNQCNITENSPSWDANSGSARQAILSDLFNPKFNYRVHKETRVNQIQSTHSLTRHFLKKRLPYPSTSPKLPKLPLPFYFPYWNSVYSCHVFHAGYICNPRYPHWFDNFNIITCKLQVNKSSLRNTVLCKPT
jgi:hypothetical protein